MEPAVVTSVTVPFQVRMLSASVIARNAMHVNIFVLSSFLSRTTDADACRPTLITLRAAALSAPIKRLLAAHKADAHPFDLRSERSDLPTRPETLKASAARPDALTRKGVIRERVVDPSGATRLARQ